LASKAAEFGEIAQNNDNGITPFNVANFSTNEKFVCDFLYVNNSKLPPILHSFQDMADY